MTERDFEKLRKKYTDEELVESFVFPVTVSPEEYAESVAEMLAARDKMVAEMTPEQKINSRLRQLRYQLEDYLKEPYNEEKSFGFFLRRYMEIIGKKNKEFASDIDISEVELSQILNKHRKPNEKIIIRLEIHSSKLIKAILWFKLLEKEKEHEILTNTQLRIQERKHVKNIVGVQKRAS